MQLTDQKLETATLFDSAKGRGRSILKAIAANPKIAVGVGIVAVFILAAIAAPLLTPYDPSAAVITKGLSRSIAPNSQHILGTTGLGQHHIDIFDGLNTADDHPDKTFLPH